jgi:hypothetical protein
MTNKHDLIAARIVGQALAAERMPKNAAQAVRSALGMVGTQGTHLVPEDQLQHQAVEPKAAIKGVQDAQTEAALTELGAHATERIGHYHHAILVQVLEERRTAGEVDTVDVYGLDQLGVLKQFGYPDGRSEYDLNGKTLVTFWPPKVSFEDGYMNVEQAYRVAV